MVGKRGINRSEQDAVKESTYLGKDVEEGRPQQDRKHRFRDQATLDPDDQRRVEFKKKLLESVEGGGLERYRKSDKEVYPLSSLLPLMSPEFPKLTIHI